MKIIIEQDGKEDIVFDDVQEYFLCGLTLRDKIVLQKFDSWNGTFQNLIGDVYFQLKELERRYVEECDGKG